MVDFFTYISLMSHHVCAKVRAPHSCISSVLQSCRNREAGRARCTQPSRCLQPVGKLEIKCFIASEPTQNDLDFQSDSIHSVTIQLAAALRGILSVLQRKKLLLSYYFSY